MFIHEDSNRFHSLINYKIPSGYLNDKAQTALRGACAAGRRSPRGGRAYCWASSAVLLAFIFSSRLARWLLVISISSILSSAVRSCKREKSGHFSWSETKPDMAFLCTLGEMELLPGVGWGGGGGLKCLFSASQRCEPVVLRERAYRHTET